ncbi:chromate transporter [Paenibacillus sp. FJAT-27812]|uniref:chromate transporter n=1 Tax=Paenibacillus sp. FJAT-27812 TaxID=1684143 RepID=UPI0006A7C502|nr:chromate transporter [Paenibacillus sp. FJAT-27812]
MDNRKGLAKKLFELFWTFFCIAPASFGGGYAMLPAIEKEVVDKRGWLDRAEMNNLISIASSAPGGVGVNAAAFIGYRHAGVYGSAAAVAGITLPTFGIVCILSFVYGWFDEYPKVIAALKGIHAAIVALIVVAAFKIAQTSLVDKTTIGIALSTLGLLLFTDINPTFIIVTGLFAGIILVKAKESMGKKVILDKSANFHRQVEMTYPEYYI